MPLRVGASTRSADASARRVPLRIITLSVSSRTPKIESNFFCVAGSTPISTAMTTSARPVCLITSAGTLFRTPPSTSTLPSKETGENTPGMATVARRARASQPESNTTVSALRRSVATARNGVGSALKSSWLPKGAARRAKSRSACSAALNPEGILNPPRRPKRSADGKRPRVFLAAERLVDKRRVGGQDRRPVDTVDPVPNLVEAPCPSRTRRRPGRPCWCRR